MRLYLARFFDARPRSTDVDVINILCLTFAARFNVGAHCVSEKTSPFLYLS